MLNSLANTVGLYWMGCEKIKLEIAGEMMLYLLSHKNTNRNKLKGVFFNLHIRQYKETRQIQGLICKHRSPLID